MDTARKSDRNKRINEKIIPETKTRVTAEKKSSFTRVMSFSADRKRIIDSPKPSVAKGTNSETAAYISENVPYKEAPNPLVKIGTCKIPSKRVAIFAAII